MSMLAKRFQSLVGAGAIATSVLVGFLMVVACAPEPQYKKVVLPASGQPKLASASQPVLAPLRVAVAGVISPKETYKTYQDLLQHLGSRLDRPVELVQRKSYAEINDLIRAGGVDLAFVCSEAFVQGQQDFGMELLAAPEVRGEALYRSYLIVPRDSLAQQLEDLRGKIFAFTDPDSNSGWLVPTYSLMQIGETPDSFFHRVVYTYSHDNSIKAVAEKLVDGAAVDSLVYDYLLAQDPALVERTRVIWRSRPFGSPPAVVHPGLSADLKERLRNPLPSRDGAPRGRPTLDGLMIDRFIVPDQTAYQPVRDMLVSVRGRR